MPAVQSETRDAQKTRNENGRRGIGRKANSFNRKRRNDVNSVVQATQSFATSSQSVHRPAERSRLGNRTCWDSDPRALRACAGVSADSANTTQPAKLGGRTAVKPGGWHHGEPVQEVLLEN